MKLLVVIVSYKVTDLTIDCLRSLSGEIGRVPGARVALCENGTGGDAADRLQQAIDENGWGSWVDLTVLHPNRGFTGGNNALIRPALAGDDPPEYVLLLNSDTIVLEHALDTIVEFMDSHPAVGIAASWEIAPDGSVMSIPFRFPGIAAELDRGLRLGIVSKLLSRWTKVPVKDFQKPCKPDWVCFASAIFRRTMLEQIGLLDEGLFTYFDDADLCLRANRAGWESWLLPQSRVIHYGGATTGVTDQKKRSRLPAYWFQARRRFFLKNYGAWHTLLIDAAFILGFMAWRIRRRIQRKPDTDPPHMLFDSIRHSVFCADSGCRWSKTRLCGQQPRSKPSLPAARPGILLARAGASFPGRLTSSRAQAAFIESALQSQRTNTRLEPRAPEDRAGRDSASRKCSQQSESATATVRGKQRRDQIGSATRSAYGLSPNRFCPGAVKESGDQIAPARCPCTGATRPLRSPGTAEHTAPAHG